MRPYAAMTLRACVIGLPPGTEVAHVHTHRRIMKSHVGHTRLLAPCSAPPEEAEGASSRGTRALVPPPALVIMAMYLEAPMVLRARLSRSSGRSRGSVPDKLGLYHIITLCTNDANHPFFSIHARA